MTFFHHKFTDVLQVLNKRQNIVNREDYSNFNEDSKVCLIK